MPDESATQTAGQPREKKAKTPAKQKRERLAPGTLPPFFNLTEAFELAKQVNDNGGGRANADLMSQLTGNSSSSSTYNKKVNSLKSYGLIAPDGDVLALTELGVEVAAPRSPEAGAQAKKESFLKIDHFKTLYERHKGKLLPESQYLRNIIEQDLKINKEFSQAWMAAFQDGLKAAGLSSARTDGKIQIRELAMAAPYIPPPADKPTVTPTVTPVVGGGDRVLSDKAMPITLGIGRVAQIDLGPEWKTSDLPRLLTMLCLALGDGQYTIEVKKSSATNGSLDNPGSQSS